MAKRKNPQNDGRYSRKCYRHESLPTSNVLPRGKAGLVVRRNLSASAMFFFPCRPLASGSRANRSAYTRRNLCLTENAQQAQRFRCDPEAGAMPESMTNVAACETIAVALERRGEDA
jgi:hypothetical protein